MTTPVTNKPISTQNHHGYPEGSGPLLPSSPSSPALRGDRKGFQASELSRDPPFPVILSQLLPIDVSSSSPVPSRPPRPPLPLRPAPPAPASSSSPSLSPLPDSAFRVSDIIREGVRLGGSRRALRLFVSRPQVSSNVICREDKSLLLTPASSNSSRSWDPCFRVTCQPGLWRLKSPYWKAVAVQHWPWTFIEDTSSHFTP
mmetsp:Transcript_30738/g.73693  ORF Transcript_30738/g.73693 Transcript_30738/m.73693 type:complete len:201 (-) Transcript_30738:1235-1837(-)